MGGGLGAGAADNQRGDKTQTEIESALPPPIIRGGAGQADNPAHAPVVEVFEGWFHGVSSALPWLVRASRTIVRIASRLARLVGSIALPI